MGEIDIVAEENGELVFIEVKTRKSEELGYPEQSVGIKKQKKISQLALYYLQKRKLKEATAPFDVVAITMSDSKNEIKVDKKRF